MTPSKIDHTGKRFGRRVVLGSAGRQGARALWHVRCDCGHDYTALVQTLTKTTGCEKCAYKGPRPYRRLRPFEAIYNALIQRGRHPVNLTYEQFANFTKQTECHYCGAPVSWSEHRKPGHSTATNLDRKDNDGIYEVGNVVVACLRCNKSKNTHFTYEEWMQLGAVIRNWREIDAERKTEAA